MNKKLTGYLENIFLGIIGGILTNVVFAFITAHFFPSIVVINQYKTISTVIFILITPIFVNYLFRKLNINLSQIRAASLIFIIILLEAVFFSSIPTQEIEIDQSVTLASEYSKYFEGIDLKTTPYNQVWTLDDAEIGTVKNELHMLLNVEWEKKEKMKGLKRNYQGNIYYKMNLLSNLSQGKTEMKTAIISYSFRPGSGVLSYIVGFVDTGYMIRSRKYFTSEIEDTVRENRILEDIKERR